MLCEYACKAGFIFGFFIRLVCVCVCINLCAPCEFKCVQQYVYANFLTTFDAASAAVCKPHMCLL